MEIDDILASVDHGDISSPESTALDHQLLTRFWVAERSVPELLPWPGRLMDRMMERVRQQIETIEDLAAASSEYTSTTTTGQGASTNTSTSTSTSTATLKLSILQTDLSRTQYLLRSLLRQRLSKLTKHSMHYLLLSTATPHAPAPPPSSASSFASESKQIQPEDSIPTPLNPPPPHCPLSASEIAFLHTHQTLLARHFGSSFLSSFPPQLRRLDDNAGGTSMLQGPDAKEAVFVRCLAEEVGIVAPPEPGDGIEEEVVGGTMRMGDVWVVRWEAVRGAWERGDVEIL
ncbi:putative GINS DNA replication complex subunit Sld5 [Aspergillus lucknowensis]|uniref:DNA replication complex GINS protein SLD5 n=1 Tax=Aspergillus lucknowensis TaxID=176173 RepID=A0ABR4M2S7_9EURO